MLLVFKIIKYSLKVIKFIISKLNGPILNKNLHWISEKIKFNFTRQKYQMKLE